eukprot:383471-Hanusia_phi.AAC.2
MSWARPTGLPTPSPPYLAGTPPIIFQDQITPPPHNIFAHSLPRKMPHTCPRCSIVVEPGTQDSSKC